MAGRSTKSTRPKLGRRAIPAIAGVAVIALVGTLAVFSEGYDAKEIPPLETSVWVTRDAGQYARVNTDLAEIDTVRSVADPAGVAQSGADAVVFSSGYRQLWPVNAANPLNLTGDGAPVVPAADPATDDKAADDKAADDKAEDDKLAADGKDLTGAQNTPAGTREVLSAGNYLLYLTDTGSVFVSVLTTDNGEPPNSLPCGPFCERRG